MDNKNLVPSLLNIRENPKSMCEWLLHCKASTTNTSSDTLLLRNKIKGKDLARTLKKKALPLKSIGVI